jgi:hypothetical protein
LALFVLALLPRLYSAQTLGWDWDAPGSFTLVNFDEGGSCRAYLKGFPYSTFIGRQTTAIADLLGAGPDRDIVGDPRAVKSYCHSPAHILVARSYSAVAGALTVVMIAVLGLLLVPGQPAVAWTAGSLLALSGFHISESHSGTVDAPSVFFIYAFLALMVFAVVRQSARGLWLSPLLLVPAIWTKYWVFAPFAYLALVPGRVWAYVGRGMSARRMVAVLAGTIVLAALFTNSEFQQAQLYPLGALYYLLIPWRRIHLPMALLWLSVPVLAYLLLQVELIHTYTTGTATTAFGNGYADIGWHKLLRNLVNIPAVLIVGIGLPACLFIPRGLRYVAQLTAASESDSDENTDETAGRGWLCLAPLLVFALYMASVAPVTYYRHYLALIPVACLLAACGLWASNWSARRWFMILFFAWPALLAVDFVLDYHRDPRIELRQWYASHGNPRVFASFYVNPPPASRGNSPLFRPEYAEGDAATLRHARYLVLSENWYDTAFANELNGPLTGEPGRLVKTTPAHARFYRDALAGRHPYLELEQVLPVHNFMPELWLHSRLYGTFQLFVGDIRIWRVHD